MTEEKRMAVSRSAARKEAVIIAQEIHTGKLTTLAGLKPCRERAGMNQKELSKAAGICADTYRAWEYGANWPSAFHLAKLATVLGVSIEELYLGPDPDGGQP